MVQLFHVTSVGPNIPDGNVIARERITSFGDSYKVSLDRIDDDQVWKFIEVRYAGRLAFHWADKEKHGIMKVGLTISRGLLPDKIVSTESDNGNVAALMNPRVTYIYNDGENSSIMVGDFRKGLV